MKGMDREMTKIQNYVENVFSGIPKTKEAVEMKLGIIDSMEEKYAELIAGGKNEHEAFGEVIADFGSIDEIRQELGYDGEERSEPAAGSLHQTGRKLDAEFQKEYEQFKKKFAIAITAGVALCILAVIAMLVLDEIMPESSNIPLVAFLLIILAAVCLFIYFGMQEEKYERQKRQSIADTEIDEALRQQILEEISSSKKNPVADSLCGIIMLAATVLFLLLGFLKGMWHPGWIVFPVGGILCGIVNIIAQMVKKS
jgi:hypothetical protein